MRVAGLMLVLAGCAAAPAPENRAAEVAACAAAVAAHVGKAVDAVSASWTGTTDGGHRDRDGERRAGGRSGAGAYLRGRRRGAGAGDPASRGMSLEFRLRVYYEDTDAGGIVYYANYLKFIERARTEALLAAGMSQTELRARLGIVFAVREVTVSYLAPARLEDELVVRRGSRRRGGRGSTWSRRSGAGRPAWRSAG